MLKWPGRAKENLSRGSKYEIPGTIIPKPPSYFSAG